MKCMSQTVSLVDLSATVLCAVDTAINMPNHCFHQLSQITHGKK